MKQEQTAPLEIIRGSEIEPKEVKWLWYPYIPFGKVTIIQGDPGEGFGNAERVSCEWSGSAEKD